MTTSSTGTINVSITTPAWTSVDAVDMVVKVTNDQVTSVALPESLRLSGTGKDTKVVRVVADGNIVIYGGNQQINSGDSYLVYPITSLGRTYVIATFESISLLSTVYQPLFGIAAVYDDTEVTITFKTNDLITIGGITYSGVVAITLQKYEVLQIVNGGAIGALVNATKDIVVNSGHYFLHVDPGYSRDHIEEQLLATDYWSKEYVVVSSNMETNERDQVRIYSFHTETTIEIDNGDTQSIVQLQEAGSNYDMQLRNFSLVIRGDKPIQVAQIGTTPDASNFGDPFLYMTTGTSHFLHEFTFLTPCIGASVVYDNYIVIIADSKAAGHVELDGILLSFKLDASRPQ